MVLKNLPSLQKQTLGTSKNSCMEGEFITEMDSLVLYLNGQNQIKVLDVIDFQYHAH